MSDEKKTDRRKPGGSEPLEQTKKLDSAAVNAATMSVRRRTMGELP